jgi:hypothetical protein
MLLPNIFFRFLKQKYINNLTLNIIQKKCTSKLKNKSIKYRYRHLFVEFFSHPYFIYFNPINQNISNHYVIIQYFILFTRSICFTEKIIFC